LSPEIDKRIPAALLILRFFLAIFLLQWSIEKLILPDAAARIARSFYGVTLPVEGSYALGIAELIVSLALLLGFLSDGQLRPLVAHSYRDGGGELAAVIRSMGAGQGRQSPVDIDMADLGRLCRAVLDARMGHLDSRWLASIAKRSSTDRSGSLGTGDTVHMSIAPPTIDTQEEGSHGCCEREDHRYATYSW
jgi:hypothetical protein